MFNRRRWLMAMISSFLMERFPDRRGCSYFLPSWRRVAISACNSCARHARRGGDGNADGESASRWRGHHGVIAFLVQYLRKTLSDCATCHGDSLILVD